MASSIDRVAKVARLWRLSAWLLAIGASTGMVACAPPPASSDDDDDDEATDSQPGSGESPLPTGGDPDAGDTGTSCAADAECQNDDDCTVDGESCVNCACVPMNTGGQCESYGPGSFDDCRNQPITVCGSPNAVCVVDDPNAPDVGFCTARCTSDCQCPAPPDTGTAPVSCGPLVLQDQSNGCVLDCSRGHQCPDGMACSGGTLEVCVHYDGEAPPAYGNCLASNGFCGQGRCFQGVPGSFFCSPECDGGAACPAAPSGTAVPTCVSITAMDGGMETGCMLDCSTSECPTGMECIPVPGFRPLCMFSDDGVDPPGGTGESGTGSDSGTGTDGGSESGTAGSTGVTTGE